MRLLTKAGNPQKQYRMSAVPDNERRLILAELAEYVTAPECELLYGVSRITVAEACQAGWIVARKSGATWIMRKVDAHARWGIGRTAIGWSAE